MTEETESLHDKEEKTLSLLNQILSYKGLIIGIAAVLTALASWFKPVDVTATKATYEVLSVRVNELSKTTSDLSKSIEDNHDEMTALKSYLEGFNNGRLSGNTNTVPNISVAANSKVIQKPKVAKITDFTDSAPTVAAIEQPKLDVAQVATKMAQAPAAAAAPLPPFEKVIK